MDLLRKGSYSFYDITYYFVWKTKGGVSILRGKVATRAIQIIKGVCEEKKWSVISGKTSPTHVHLILSCSGDVSPAKIMQFIKGKSGYLLQREFQELRGCSWERGYFCKSLGSIEQQKIEEYLLNHFPSCSHSSSIKRKAANRPSNAKR